MLALTASLAALAPAAEAQSASSRSASRRSGSRLGLVAEGGPAFDSNALRGWSDQPVTSGALMRGLLRGQLDLRWSRHRLNLSGGAGAKAYIDQLARAADEAVAWVGLDWHRSVGESGSVGLLSSYYDAFVRAGGRDFRSGSALLTASVGDELRAQLHGGYEALEVKSATEFSYHSLVAGVRVLRDVVVGREDDAVGWRLALGYRLAVRDFRGQPYGGQEPCQTPNATQIFCSFPKSGSRQDLNHRLRLSVTYSGNMVASLWYGFELNRSNSFGETFVRQSVGVKFTAALAWRLDLTVSAILQFSRFADPFFVRPVVVNQDFVSSEDESRSQLFLQFTRDIGFNLAAVARLAVFFNETRDQGSDSPGFRRVVGFFGLRYSFRGDM